MRSILILACLTAVFASSQRVAVAQVAAGKSKGKSLKEGITTYGNPPLKSGTKPAGKKGPVTTITVELLTQREKANTRVHDWVEVLGKMDVTVTVRNGHPEDKLGVTENKEGGALRSVKVVAALDERSRMALPDQTFSLDDLARLSNWVKELRVYGAQGDPNGQQVWGLTREQFDVIFTALKKALTKEVKDLPVSKAIAMFELPRQHPLVFSSAATKRLQELGDDAKVKQLLAGISQGTALAIVLSEQGLGFRPNRLPDGRIELSIVAPGESRELWPVGWPRQKEIPEIAPTLFQIKPIDLTGEPLDQVLEAMSGQIKLPILIDYAGLAAKDIDLAEVKITYPFKKTTWISAIKEFTFKARAKAEVVIDESGQPFLWVVPLDAPSRAPKG